LRHRRTVPKKLDIRVSPEAKRVLREAARERHTTISQFVIDSAISTVQEVFFGRAHPDQPDLRAMGRVHGGARCACTASPANGAASQGAHHSRLTDMGEKPQIAKLAPAHDPTSFECGNDALNRFIKLYVLPGQRAGISRTYVAATELEIAGYYTLVVGHVAHAEAPERFAKAPLAGGLYATVQTSW